jgi:hypothetical protein
MRRFTTKLCVVVAVYFVAYAAFAAWTIDVPATSNPPTEVKQDGSLMASGKSEIFNGNLRVKAKKTGLDEEGIPYDWEFDQDIMTEMDGGWSYDIVPNDLWWDNLGEHLVQIFDAGGSSKAGRFFAVVEP